MNELIKIQASLKNKNTSVREKAKQGETAVAYRQVLQSVGVAYIELPGGI